MTAFLVVLVIVLFGVALWQMAKIFELSKPKSDTSDEIANDQDNQINGKLMLMFVGFIYVLAFISHYKWSKVFLPQAASEHGVDIDQLWLISMVLIFVVGIITQWLLHFFAFKYRGRQGQKATFFADNDKLEFIWTIIPVPKFSTTFYTIHVN